MNILLDILGSAGFGSILGGVFGWLTKKEERANLKAQLDHELAMLKARTDATLAIAQASVEEAKIAGQLVVEKLEAQAFVASQKTGGKLAEALKAIVRPIILGLLMYQTYLILQALEELTGGLTNMNSSEAMDLYRIVILSITSLTSTAVGWYFAARTSKQFDKLLERSYGRK